MKPRADFATERHKCSGTRAAGRYFENQLSQSCLAQSDMDLASPCSSAGFAALGGASPSTDLVIDDVVPGGEALALPAASCVVAGAAAVGSIARCAGSAAAVGAGSAGTTAAALGAAAGAACAASDAGTSPSIVFTMLDVAFSAPA